MGLFAHGRIGVQSGWRLVVVNVRIARTPLARERGLQQAKRLRPNEGMLFVFPSNRRWSMWMHNTPISLDMIFANHEGRVVAVVQGTEPYSHTPIIAPVPVRYILEVPAGFAAKSSVSADSVLRPV